MDNREYAKESPARIKKIVGNTAWVWLWTYTACLTIASFYADYFWESRPSWVSGVGLDQFIPVTSTNWERHWSIEEYLVFLLLPWIVTYHLKKGQRSDA